VNVEDLLASIRSNLPDSTAAVEYFDEGPLLSQMMIVARSTVVVAVHGAALASTIALRPSSSVVELLPPSWQQRVGLSNKHSLFGLLSQGAAVSSHTLLQLTSSDAVFADSTHPFSANFSLTTPGVAKIVDCIVNALRLS
jgi:hypothetical protein